MFNFPAITMFNDYHEIEDFESNLNDLFDLKGKNRIKSVELYANRYNLPEFIYYGLFYIDRKPNNKEILEIIKNKFTKNIIKNYETEGR